MLLHFFMQIGSVRLLGYALIGISLLPGGHLSAQDSRGAILERIEKADENQIQQLISRFPDADENGDGKLTKAEAMQYAQAMLGKAKSASVSAEVSPEPEVENVPYGPHERNVLDLWKAAGEGLRPLVVLIHGGGFTSGDKSKWRSSPLLRQLLESGISCAAINYRFRQEAPIQEILRDASRAVQYLRSRAQDWSLDPAHFAGLGGSAGAGTSLWLVTRDDLADPDSDDPVLRQSSRLQAAVLFSTQATYDLTRWESFLGPSDPEWWKSPNEMAEFYHLKERADLAKPESQAILQEVDMLRWISADDGALLISNPLPDVPSTQWNEYLHHPAHAREIDQACDAAGVTCFWRESGKSEDKIDPVDFLSKQLFTDQSRRR